jgi:hypothetical protein
LYAIARGLPFAADAAMGIRTTRDLTVETVAGN